MMHDKFNMLVREMAEKYHMPELHARCYLVNYYTLRMCDRCRDINDCAFIHALEKEEKET